MYTEYWGLKEKPFENVPNPRFFYYSSSHEEALMRLLYTVKEKKAGIWVTGEMGTGKTILSRVLVRLLEKEKVKYEIVVLVNPTLPTTEFVSDIIYQFGRPLPPPTTPKVELLHQLENILYENVEKGEHNVILVDEAHTIVNEEVFEELRLMLNYQKNEASLLTLVFLGQPELAKKIGRNKPLEQRLSLLYQLKPLSLEETMNYILFRLEVAGLPVGQKIFIEESYGLIYKASGGVPRIINNLCDVCLLMGFSRKVQRVNEEIVAAVIEDIKKAEDILKGE